ncbi:VanZ like family protein [Acetitomaculum ruminis DSM 5522]|uniref:VanZ like family protein n=1 Tax=Acetitomaculum ruminis DSM 5522 TaxID=1120918 RepID=A0A1I0ZAD9_9FIRM|nr:VanZ family protein [Acetitomaculum ruminis]SFB22729.1 VanZ like family protein [Acetitomaculum ruminis DSM 5522]
MELEFYSLLPEFFQYEKIILLLILGGIFGISVISRFFLDNTKWKHLTGFLLLIYWGIIVLNMTIIGRIPSDEPQINMQLFMCFQRAWDYQSALYWYFIIGNIVMFIPVGIILPVFFESKRAYWKVILTGFFLSLAVESSQYFFNVGVFELDDLFNNTVGAGLGYSLFVIFNHIISKDKNNILQSIEEITSFIMWLITVLGLGIATLCGQPVFEYFTMR